MNDEQSGPTHDEIARRAHEISERGGSGDHQDNWYKAEAELRAEREAPAKPKRRTTRKKVAEPDAAGTT